jgi:DNA topoisomerase-1
MHIVVRDGRFGPYVTDGVSNASLRTADDPMTISVERASDLLSERRAKEALEGPPAKKAAARKVVKKAAAKKAATKKAADRNLTKHTVKKAATKKAAAKRAVAKKVAVAEAH